MRGFKALNKDLTCRGFQYEIGGTYEFEGEPIPCKQGFHFCKSIAECYDFYPVSDDTRICVVDAIGDINTDDKIKYCTNKIVILEEITAEWERKGNNSSCNTGYRNTGHRNTGDKNTGDQNDGNWNSGDWNAGNRNAGDCNTGSYNAGCRNTGDRNTGDWNSGDRNTGGYNTGDCNTGHRNTGDWNTGSYNTGGLNTGSWNAGCRNTGHCNTGDYNTGRRNTGDWNSGDWNAGNRNSGDCNTGSYNAGDYNTGDWNTGVFNADTPYLTFFDKPSDWTYDQWLYSDARRLLNKIEKNGTEWIPEEEMTDTEKKQNPSYKTTGGYLKILNEKENAQLWWDSLTEEEIFVIRNLPNYDEKKFKSILGLN